MIFSHSNHNGTAKRLVMSTALITIVSFGLGACETSQSKFDGSAPLTTASITKKTSDKTSKTKKKNKTKSSRSKAYKVSLAPIGGLPKKLSKTFSRQLKRAIKNEQITTASSKKHKITGYFAATAQKGKTKLSYVLDVKNKAGKRIKRIHGQELVKGHPSDPWKNVSASVLKKIASRTALTLSASLETPKSKTVRMAKMPSEKENDAHSANRAKAKMRKAPTRTAAIKTSGDHSPRLAAIIPAVEGAPGDGKISLTRAITQQLASQGIQIEKLQSPGVHSVKGYVSLASLNPQQDEITIKWLVFNSKGRRLGIVSQKNVISKGSLNGSWGRIANAAANAASKGIRKLLPAKKNKI